MLSFTCIYSCFALLFITVSIVFNNSASIFSGPLTLLFFIVFITSLTDSFVIFNLVPSVFYILLGRSAYTQAYPLLILVYHGSFIHSFIPSIEKLYLLIWSYCKESIIFSFSCFWWSCTSHICFHVFAFVFPGQIFVRLY